ncbi:hypothetical protein ABZ899_36370, partial [Streptomyces sp. NPDC046859]
MFGAGRRQWLGDDGEMLGAGQPLRGSDEPDLAGGGRQGSGHGGSCSGEAQRAERDDWPARARRRQPLTRAEKETNQFRIAETQSIRDEAKKRGVKLLTANA